MLSYSLIIKSEQFAFEMLNVTPVELFILGSSWFRLPFMGLQNQYREWEIDGKIWINPLIQTSSSSHYAKKKKGSGTMDYFFSQDFGTLDFFFSPTTHLEIQKS